MLFRYLSGELEDPDGYELRRRTGLNRTEAQIGLSQINGIWQIDFHVRTVHDAANLMLINNLTSGKDQIRKCALDDCPKFFLVRNPRATYCCAKHSQLGLK